MKKLLLYLGLFLFVSGSVSAQEKYTYLKGQNSPFNGEFNELRYIDVDSISYELHLYSDGYFEDFGGFLGMDEGYTLIKRSSDGLTDTLQLFRPPYHSIGLVGRDVKKYSNDGKLVSSSSAIVYFFPDETPIDRVMTEYVYDTEGRISEITTIKNDDVTVYDTVKYDYEFKQHTPTLKYNLIESSGYSKKDSMFVFYNDSGYMTIQEYPTYDYDTIAYRVDSVEYVFDSQGRLVKRVESYILTPKEGFMTTPDHSLSVVFDYKYTDNGYEEYKNGIKMLEHKFQNDGYCTEMIWYEYSDAAVIPPVSSRKTIRKISYFENGEVIVSNESMENVAPKVYGVQGGIATNTEKPLSVSIYTFSGSLVKQEKVSAGTNTIHLAGGLYVVVIGRMSYKVLVR